MMSDCGCYVTIREIPERPSTGYMVIIYCPKHKAAPEMYEALSPDLSGRRFEDLLLIVAKKFDDDGGGPLVDCLIDKAYKIRAALALADGSDA